VRKLVYIETTVPSFYHEARTDAEAVARRNWTRKWWDGHSHDYDLATGVPVIDELRRGDYPGQQDAVALALSVPLLPVVPEVREIAEAYAAHHVMPRDPAGDALHLAMASWWKCDFLLTWNCEHLANANKFEHIRKVNALLGLFVPTLTTPLELLGEEVPRGD
jgi:hypothetical protein